ncbi:hypothetical protein COCC4DRAFT_20815 [Bipolaris maydis ATCC 48331]|uniref:Uncharacterized protein n=2 Tax=Cochliobolus heterostrophus TaxID=5016 RepID=M2UES6_COCH5|nr:uncharacterized protein COCC4DRAFT_20815 [Bipolaris maydis ATCC 48331]EMD92206.1 hypothetical protein COCHEDRAFT_1224084 [Bipolaris maydis C5]KAH7550834.1 hypothetical protein BM1_10207 [Bipolaris maydis]ENI07899.1 hypothetical protein COCC4DRAFT_20815 [Bipolaris maydis ATCC 48331]KAJ5022062.1 hypothetical protein J3E73DRAFT_385174 [Bipolaris maydis]KAJ5060746.1 hypothetical protein J3E74DRAFT_268789 [Bipolaris maydis]
MDHWGDPWADSNVEQQKSPNKNAVISPPPPSLAPAPVLLNGFLDDAGWGNEDESFGDWRASTGISAPSVAHVESRQPSPSPLRNHNVAEDTLHWGVDEGAKDAIPNIEETWAGQNGESSDLDNGTSDTSDTSTTIQADADADADPERNEKDVPTRSQPDDDDSARPSTPQSEISRPEAPVESSRTSLEDEEATAKHTIDEVEPKQNHGNVGKKGDEEEYHGSISDSDSTEEEYGTSTADTLLTQSPQDRSDAAEDAPSDSKEDEPRSSTSPCTEPTPTSLPTTTTAAQSHIGRYQLDATLLDELFPSKKNGVELDEAPEDPIYSTSGRKAWYRLTRKQTMKEFNSGNSDDSYVRVTWPGSQVRSEVHKTVARWAREDRMSGTGPGARASFYWDTPAPVEPRIPKGHQRTKTSVPTERINAPMRQSLPPMATNTAAAFNWASPTSTGNPWKQDNPSLNSVVSLPTSKPIAIHNEQTQNSRPVSMDLTHGVGERLGSTVISLETPNVANTTPPPPPTTTSANSWGDTSTLDTNTAGPKQSTNVPEDEDDDWGEMISSPTVFSPVSAFPNSISATPDNTVSTLDPAPEKSPLEDSSADAMHAASIVRLKSTISPTSAVFGRKSFVPFGAEHGPIGPGILKPVKRSVASTAEKPKPEALSVPLRATPPHKAQEATLVRESEKTSEVKTKDPEPLADSVVDDFSVFETSTLESGPVQPMTPPRAPAKPEPTVDSWADADFSIFESAPTTAIAQPKAKHEPRDPFSVFQTPPPRPNSAASSAKTFTRSSPPRVVTPPAIQPLTGATNSAQRRKNEEDRTIREILAGLPDLSYMLR